MTGKQLSTLPHAPAHTFSFRKLFLKLFPNSGHSFLEGAAGKSLHFVVEVR